MLNLNLRDSVPSEVRGLFTQWRREHVSKYAVNVEQLNDEHIDIVDSRFASYSNQRDRLLGFLSWQVDEEHGRRRYTLSSRLISNKKFGTYNQNHCTKATHDVRKVAKWVRSYLHPFTLDEIAKRTIYRVESEVSKWVEEPEGVLNSMIWSVDRIVLGKAIVELAALGVQINPPELRNLATKGPPLVVAHADRLTKKGVLKHVLINHDDTVVISSKVSEQAKDFTLEGTYQSLELCPIHIQQQVALLRMKDNNPDEDISLLPMVGTKISPFEFWIIEQN